MHPTPLSLLCFLPRDHLLLDRCDLVPELSLLPALPLLNHLHISLSHQSLLNLDVEGVLEFLFLADKDIEGRGGDEVVRSLQLMLLGSRGWEAALQMSRLVLPLRLSCWDLWRFV